MSRPPFGDPGVCPTIALFSSTTNHSPFGGLFSTAWIRLNPDIRIFFLLFFARVVALLGYLFRSVLGFHRDELYNFTVLGVNALLLAGAFSLLYFAWLIYSELGTLG